MIRLRPQLTKFLTNMPNETGIEDTRPRWLIMLTALIMAPASWALVDQAIVSGTRFATTMLIGRFCGPEGLGIYVMAFAVMLIAITAHESLIASPYQVFCQRKTGIRHRAYSGSVLLQFVVLALATCLLSGITAGILAGTSVNPGVMHATLAMSLTLPGVLLWEFTRRQAFARLNMQWAVLIDASLATLQLASLFYVGWIQQLTVPRSLLLIGMAGGLVGLTAVLWTRQNYVLRKQRIWLDIRRNLAFGNWLFAGQIVGIVQAYTVPLLLAYRFGTVATGVVMACQTLVLLSNPFLIGLANWLGPTAARGYANGGVIAIAKITNRATLVIAATMILFCAVLVLWGEQILVLCFGADYAGYGHIVGITGLSAIGFGVTIAGTCGLAAIQRPRLILIGTLSGTIVTIVAFFALSGAWQLTGAAWAMALGSIAAASVHILGFWWSLGNLRNSIHSELATATLGSSEA